jgi:hypothetical protein
MLKGPLDVFAFRKILYKLPQGTAALLRIF